MDLIPGDLVYLTNAYEKYLLKRNPSQKVPMVNRIAKLDDIIDWESPNGQKIKRAREMCGKWEDLPLEDNKYIFTIYYPELIGRNKKKGVIQRGTPLFSKDPNTGEPFFEKLPDWMYKDLISKSAKFDVELKDVS